MNDSGEGNTPYFRNLEDKLVWTLHQLIRSSKIRGKYFKHINEFYSQYIANNITPDSRTGVFTENKEIYDAIHSDFIFRVLGVIESLQGAMAAAWKYSVPGRRNLESILSILVDPRGHKGDVEKHLRENSLTEKTICRLFAIHFFHVLKRQPETD